MFQFLHATLLFSTVWNWFTKNKTEHVNWSGYLLIGFSEHRKNVVGLVFAGNVDWV